MKYLIVLKQIGEGCDYMIGCGMTYKIMEANSVEDLIESLKFTEGRNEPFCSYFTGEYAIDKLMIIPFDHVLEVDVLPLREDVKAYQLEYKRENQRLKDLAEFERLKEKLKI